MLVFPLIREWMEEDGYDVIFLATEDQDILDQMVGEFGKKFRAIEQERHRVSDFRKGQTISQPEEEERSGKEREAALEDTTVNYFYALYILSRCDSFKVSGQCNGWDVVNSFNQGKFKRAYRFQVGVKNEEGIDAGPQETVYGTEPYAALRETPGSIPPKA